MTRSGIIGGWTIAAVSIALACYGLYLIGSAVVAMVTG